MPKFRPSLLDTLLAGTRAPVEAQTAQTESIFPGIRLFSLDRMSEASFLETMRRDLSWLLNTVRLEDTLPLDDTDHVASSVLNYGIPDFSTRTRSSVNVVAAAAGMAHAIRTYEPRIESKSLAVKGTKVNSEDAHQSLVFQITCNVGHTVDALAAGFTTQIDVETGDAKMEERR